VKILKEEKHFKFIFIKKFILLNKLFLKYVKHEFEKPISPKSHIFGNHSGIKYK